MKRLFPFFLAVFLPVLALSAQTRPEKDRLYTLSPSSDPAKSVGMLPGGQVAALVDCNGLDKLQLWTVEDLSGSFRISNPFENKALNARPDGKAGIAETDGCLQVPVRRENPIISVGDAAARQVTVVAFVLETAEELRTVEMETEIVPLELLAQPIANLRLGEPEVHLLVVGKRPWVISCEQVERYLLAQRDLDSSVRRGERPIERVCFDGHVLCV